MSKAPPAIAPTLTDAEQKELDEASFSILTHERGYLGVGENLLKIRAILKHGEFEPYVLNKFDFSKSTVERRMRAASILGPHFKTVKLTDLPSRSVADRLCSPSLPEDTRLALIERIKKGEAIKVDDVRAAIPRPASKNDDRPAAEIEPGVNVESPIPPAASDIIRLEVKLIECYRTLQFSWSFPDTPLDPGSEDYPQVEAHRALAECLRIAADRVEREGSAFPITVTPRDATSEDRPLDSPISVAGQEALSAPHSSSEPQEARAPCMNLAEAAPAGPTDDSNGEPEAEVTPD